MNLDEIKSALKDKINTSDTLGNKIEEATWFIDAAGALAFKSLIHQQCQSLENVQDMLRDMSAISLKQTVVSRVFENRDRGAEPPPQLKNGMETIDQLIRKTANSMAAVQHNFGVLARMAHEHHVALLKTQADLQKAFLDLAVFVEFGHDMPNLVTIEKWAKQEFLG